MSAVAERRARLFWLRDMVTAGVITKAEALRLLPKPTPSSLELAVLDLARHLNQAIA